MAFAAPAAGAAVSGTVSVQVSASDNVGVASVTVTASETDPFRSDNTATAVTTVTGVPYADLAVSQTDGGVTALWNRPLTYVITVTNAAAELVTAAGLALSEAFAV